MNIRADIRKVNANDAAILLKLSVETFTDTYGEANTPENMQQYVSENFSLSRIAEELKDPHSFIFFVLSNDVPAGYMKLNLQKDILDAVHGDGMEIARIYVKKEFQGKQLGSLLFDKAVETAKAQRMKYIWLGVWENNPKAIRFYEKMGFHAAGHHLFKLGEDLQTDVIMRYDL